MAGAKHYSLPKHRHLFLPKLTDDSSYTVYWLYVERSNGTWVRGPNMTEFGCQNDIVSTPVNKTDSIVTVTLMTTLLSNYSEAKNLYVDDKKYCLINFPCNMRHSLPAMVRIYSFSISHLAVNELGTMLSSYPKWIHSYW